MVNSKFLRCFIYSLSIFSFNSWAEFETVKIPGTTVTMSAPKGFELSNSFTGYFNESNNSSVLVVEFPKEAFAQLNQIFSNLSVAKNQFSQQGVDIREVKNIISGNGRVNILIGTQIASGYKADKYLALFEGDKTVMVTYNIFDSSTFNKNAAIQSIKSITVGKMSPLKDRLELLSFTFDTVSPFKAVDVLAGSTVILTSFDGIDKSGELPLIVIGSSIANVKVDNEKLYSRELLRTIKGFEQSKIKFEGSVQFSGLNAYKIEAEADHKTAIQIVVMNHDGSYLRFISTGNSKKIQELTKEINKIISSVKTKA